MPIKKKDRKVRLNLEVSQEVKERLDALVLSSQSNTMTSVFQRSLALFNMVTDHLNEGGKVILKNKDGSMETLKLV